MEGTKLLSRTPIAEEFLRVGQSDPGIGIATLPPVSRKSLLIVDFFQAGLMPNFPLLFDGLDASRKPRVPEEGV